MSESEGKSGSHSPVVWAFSIIILLVFGSVSYRIATSCEQSSFELLQQLKINLGGCSKQQVTGEPVTLPSSHTEPVPPDPASRSDASRQVSNAINLLAIENGGQLLLAPNDAWAATIDGKEDDYREVKIGEEAVFAFKEERTATFDTLEMLIPKAGRNPKEFELLAGTESPTGMFRSIGSFHPQNVRVIKTGGWQKFRFPPVTAKYLKVKLRSNYEDVVWIDLYEFRLFGQLKETEAR